jgi:hypothetical protein
MRQAQNALVEATFVPVAPGCEAIRKCHLAMAHSKAGKSEHGRHTVDVDAASRMDPKSPEA